MEKASWPSGKELEVLRLLQLTGRGMYGLEIVEKSGGAVGRASIYILLGRLEEKGFVSVKRPQSAAHAGMPRPIYKINGDGARALAAAEMMGFINGRAHS
jgi:DNA-binding PadR family transcriptional regulator